MKNRLFIISFLCIVLAACNKPGDLNLYYVKIAAQGISDFPRDTLYINMTNINDIKGLNYTKPLVSVIYIATDKKTLSEIVSFVKADNDYRNPANKNLEQYGSMQISLFYKNSATINYSLNNMYSKKYLTELITVLIGDKADPKAIKKLKEQLRVIDY